MRLIGLCSSKCEVEAEIASIFTGPILTWKELASRYSDDKILLRADDVYEPFFPFSGLGRHSDVKINGNALIEAFHSGANWWVGRSGGFYGNRFREDIEKGRWREQQYEVNMRATGPPSPNYFSLREFVEAVDAT